MTITFFESVMQAATDVHCNKRKRVDSVGDDSVGQLPTNLVTATPLRIVKADFFQAHRGLNLLFASASAGANRSYYGSSYTSIWMPGSSTIMGSEYSSIKVGTG